MADHLTPMMRQYRRIKAGLPPGTILFFRLGDFYEMFFEDAKKAAPILDVALTKRNTVPMCGVPFHALDSYLGKLIRAGERVAICEQMEEPTGGKGIVQREVTRIVTPGTAIEDAVLDSRRHNFLAAIFRSGEIFGLAFLDLSTGLLEGETACGAEALRDVIRRYAPTECMTPAGQADEPLLREALQGGLPIPVTPCEDWIFEYETAYDFLTRHLGVHSLEGYGCEGNAAVVGAAGGILHYVQEDLRRPVGHVRAFRMRNASDFLFLDESTCLNLDLVPARGRPASATLLGVLDTTRTAMGARELREWVVRPSADRALIERRHDAVEKLGKDRMLLTGIREALGGVRDLERMTVRVGAGTGSPRDVMAIGLSLECLPAIRELIPGGSAGPGKGPAAELLQALAAEIVPMPELVARIKSALADEPPATTRDGGMIREGFNADLDELRKIGTEGRQWLAEFQASEQKKTGIKTLKVRHNRVFGYYIEISRGQLANVPEHYTRKQTLVNAERYIAPELKEYENKILGAHDRSILLEQELFAEIRQEVMDQTPKIQAIARSLAALDVLATLAERAVALRYVRPRMTEKDALSIRESRHPIIEQIPEAERFIPNDVRLDGSGHQLIIITGPNMAGKSTYIRQVALIVIMAQMGSFVPAAEAEIGVVDRVFTRVGASDDLARGRSTFMVEMQETANILNNATPRSLIVLDEIGRGTSTFDGISIAWAVAEYLHNQPGVKAKTLFATHYHELADLAMTMPGVKNYNVLVREHGDRVVFLRKILPGSADKSYGIQVARLAGMPPEVIDRAREILANLEEGELGETGQPKIARRRARSGKDDASQLSLFTGE